MLKSRWATPRVLLDSGFRFAHPTLPAALRRIARDTPRGLLPVALGCATRRVRIGRGRHQRLL